MPGKSAPFTLSSILFRPPEARKLTANGFDCGLGWRRRVLPPGPNSLFRRPFIAIVERIRRFEYRGRWCEKKVYGR